MTHLDHTCSAAAVQRTAILDAFGAAGDDGLSIGQMVDAGGMWWRKRVEELRRRGFLVSEDRGRCYLEREPASTEALSSGEAAHEGEAGLSRLREDQTGDSASVDADLTLFPSGSSHYREAA